MKFSNSLIIAAVLSTATISITTAQTAPPLGGAASFAVLGYSTVTNTGGTIITVT